MEGWSQLSLREAFSAPDLVGLQEERVTKNLKPDRTLCLCLYFCFANKITSTVLETQESWDLSLGQEDPLEKGMATHSSILTWRIPWKEEPGRLLSMGSQRVRHDWACTYNFSNFHIYVLIYGICFSLSDLFSCVWQSLGPSMSLQMTWFHSFYGWVIFLWIYKCRGLMYGYQVKRRIV